ncbi:MAG: ABC transporter permease subunit [Phycisphaerales bacterium]|nr:MAG: ABC transporter permease subunit [Phycisphaerales bacterium]
MSRTLAIAGREFRAYFLSPGGYIIIALFLFITGFFFWAGGFQQGQIASLRSVFNIGTWLLAFIAPAVTMRLLSEEYRAGTIEMLMTSPVNEWHIIVGKFAGAAAFLVLMLLPTVAYVIAIEMHGRPDYGELLCGYLGLLLAGAAYLSSGILASTFTASQAVAFLLALFFWLALGFSAKLLPDQLDERWARIVFALDPDLRLRDFTIGLIDSSNIVYFLSITVVFLVAAVKSLQARRCW